MPSLDIKLSESVREHAEAVARDVADAIGVRQWEHSFRFYLSVRQQIDRLRAVAIASGRDLRGVRIVEVGSGCGMFTCVANAIGLDCVGVGPSADVYAGERAAARSLLECNGVPPDRILPIDKDDRLPFGDGEADVCVAFDVLEHVDNPGAVLEQMVRVLGPDGSAYIHSPSCGAFTEVHYGIPWLPWLGRRTAPTWVRLWGRNPKYLDEMNFLDHRELRRLLRPLNGVTVLQVRPLARAARRRALHTGPAADFCRWLDDIQINEPLADFPRKTRRSLAARWVVGLLGSAVPGAGLRALGIRAVDPIALALRKSSTQLPSRREGWQGQDP
jgi:SAM-dependent methyltransferase